MNGLWHAVVSVAHARKTAVAARRDAEQSRGVCWQVPNCEAQGPGNVRSGFAELAMYVQGSSAQASHAACNPSAAGRATTAAAQREQHPPLPPLSSLSSFSLPPVVIIHDGCPGRPAARQMLASANGHQHLATAHTRRQQMERAHLAKEAMPP